VTAEEYNDLIREDPSFRRVRFIPYGGEEREGVILQWHKDSGQLLIGTDVTEEGLPATSTWGERNRVHVTPLREEGVNSGVDS
jgi:hypothetical protein